MKKRRNKSWFNSALVVSDGTMMGQVSDPLRYHHLEAAELCANSLLRSYFFTKIVGCTYSPTTSLMKPEAED